MGKRRIKRECGRVTSSGQEKNKERMRESDELRGRRLEGMTIEW